MEILNYDLTTLAVNLGLLVTVLAITMLGIITIVHWVADRRQTHRMWYDRLKRPMIMSYLDGDTPQLTVVMAIEKDTSEAMRLLLDISRKLQPEAQSRLLPLFTGLPGVGDETEAIHHSNTKRRIFAAERLALLKNESSDKALLEALDDDVLAVRYSAACSLAEHGNPDHLKPILQAFDAEHEINWYRLVEICVDYGSKSVPTLLNILDDSLHYSPNILNVAIRSLGILKEPQAVATLINMLKYPDASTRLNAAHALGDIGDPGAIPSLAEQSYDAHSSVRHDALEALGKLHADQQIPVLVESLADSSWWVRDSAARALYSLGQEGIDKLVQLLRSTEDVYVHEACLDVLSEQEALDPGPGEIVSAKPHKKLKLKLPSKPQPI